MLCAEHLRSRKTEEAAAAAEPGSANPDIQPIPGTGTGEAEDSQQQEVEEQDLHQLAEVQDNVVGQGSDLVPDPKKFLSSTRDALGRVAKGVRQDGRG